MKLNKNLLEMNVTNEDFDNELKEEKFSFTFKELAFKDSIKIMAKYNIDEKDENDLSKAIDLSCELFTESLVKWEHITDENGEELECNIENKIAIFNVNYEFCKKIMNKLSQKKLELKKK